MIHRLRRLARGIHRRSVWQVVGLFVVLGWVGLQGLELLTARIGLPEWTPTMGLILWALLLPVVIATTLVQGGLPWLRIEDLVDPNELEGLTPEQVHVIPEAHPLYREGLFTWRNAVLGGVTSGALLVTSVVAYLTMWALGIGPVGSLVAQGVIQVAEPVLIASFDNRTDDSTLGASVLDAFVADFSECRIVTLVDPDRIAEGLDRLGYDPSLPLTSARARELARAEGIKALVEGDIVPFGSGYRISVRIVLPPATSHDAQFRETVDEREDLVPAIDVLSERVRAKFGESLRVIRSGSPLVELYGPLLAPSRGR